MFRALNLDAYPRRAHFEYFRAMANPYVGTTVNLDITAFRARQRAEDKPFFLSLLHCAARAANAVPEFRQRIDGEGIVEYDFCRTSHTVARLDGTYAYCVLDARLSLDAFLSEGIEAQRRAAEQGGVDDGPDARELIFVSCLPWLSYVALTQPTPVPADSNPRLTWGKYFEDGGRTLLPFTVLVNHALVDGLQISRFYECLEDLLGGRG